MAADAGPDQVRYYGSRRAGTSGYQRRVQQGRSQNVSGSTYQPPEKSISRGAAGDRRPGCRTETVQAVPRQRRGHQRRRSHGAGKSHEGEKGEKSPCGGETRRHPRRNRPCPLPGPLHSRRWPRAAPKTGRKGKKEDAIKRFVSTRIVRETEESPDAIIAKDELYQRFERWCRDHDYAAIPDRRVFFVALKNKYALAERSVGGVPSWISIRIK